MIKLIPILTFLISITCLVHADEIDFEGRLTIKLYHSLCRTPEAEYTERGNVTVHGGATSVINFPLTLEYKKKLQTLATEDKFYRLKAIVIHNDRSETQFLSSVKACMLAQSNLSDFLNIALDHAGNVVAVTLGVSSESACQGANVQLDKLGKFSTHIYINAVNTGPIPDTASFIQKLEREKEAKERGEVKDNRSFLAKYWMYIVPVVIIMVLSSAANPDGAAAGGGRPS